MFGRSYSTYAGASEYKPVGGQGGMRSNITKVHKPQIQEIFKFRKSTIVYLPDRHESYGPFADAGEAGTWASTFLYGVAFKLVPFWTPDV